MKKYIYLFLLSFCLFPSFSSPQSNTTAFLFSFENSTEVDIDNMEGTPVFTTYGILNGPKYFGGHTGQSVSYSGWHPGDALRFGFNTSGGQNLRFQVYMQCSNYDVGKFMIRVSSDLQDWTEMEPEFIPPTVFALYGPYILPASFEDVPEVYIEILKTDSAKSSLNNLRLDEATLIGDGPLPVELVSFSAKLIEHKVVLDWSTSTEVNNYGFELMRSTDGCCWDSITFLQGNGNSNTIRHYNYTDTPFGGLKFIYKLKQIDFDGRLKYYDPVEVTMEKISQFSLEQNYPNPFNPETTIRFSLPFQTDVKVILFNLLGEFVAEILNDDLNEGYYEYKFNGRGLASGVYFYQLRAGNTRLTKKLIITK
ncbi:MAG TPA: T9SS type A sorting domain-containing protein [Melioribacteraceae bacterium]|nr:T9SS type A sorting domain-containing protein [Melioribacteraceae bacterium]